MKKNVGLSDMVIRLLLGFTLLYMGLFENPVVASSTSRTIVGFISLAPLLTGVFRFCPLYALVGIDSCGQGSEI